MASITNIILYIFLALSGIFYLTGVNEAKHSEQVLKSRGSEISPAHRGKQGEYSRNMAHMWFHHKSWFPSGQIKGLVFIAHGYGSHLGRYENLAAKLIHEGFAVFAHDTIGFGRSEGDRGHVEDWIYLVDDQLQFIESVTEKYPKKPVFLIGESMGALTQILAVQKKPTTYFNGIILSNLPLSYTMELPSQLSFFGASNNTEFKLPSSIDYALSKLNDYAPKLPFLPIQLSSDPSIQKNIEKDPLSYQGWVRVRFYQEATKTSKKVLNNLFHIKTPILVLQGEDIFPIEPNSAKKLWDGVASKDKDIKTYPGFSQQLFENVEKPTNDVINWLKARI